MLKNILFLSKKLISIKSVNGNSKGLNEALSCALSELEDFTVEKFECNGIKSALVYTGKTRPKKFKILLNIHLDVISAKEHQYKPKVVGDKLYGAGAMDMKANAVCAIFAFKELANSLDYPLGLQITTDEEIGGQNGTKYQIQKGVNTEFVLATEPTNFDIVHKAKGVLQLKVFATGKTFHGAYPWKGENAIWKMNEFLQVLKKKFPIPKSEKWATTVNLSSIETTNKTLNKIPDDCCALLDVRFIAEDSKTILKTFKQILPKGFKMEVLAHEPAVFTKKDDKYVAGLQKITKKVIGENVILRGAHGTSDVSHFMKIKSAGIEFGPIGGGIGSDSEWISIPSLETYYEILLEFLKSQK